MFSLDEIMSLIGNSENPYYVYVLHKPDGLPFYVGKATVRKEKYDQRISYHECEAKSKGTWKKQPHFNRLKINTICKIWKESKEVLYSIDSWHENEIDAYNRENELILKLGLKIEGKGPLTNLTEGGIRQMTTACEKTRQQISESLKKYYKENPDKVQEMAERNKQYFIDNPEAREKSRQESIKNNSSQNIINWLATADEETLNKKWEEHSERMKIWHQDNKEKTKEIAAKRNEKFRGEEHRNHMSAATAKYIKENPEADKARRAKVKETKDKKIKIKTECYEMIKSYLIKNGQFNPNNKFIMWKIKNSLPQELLDILSGPDNLPSWENKKVQVSLFTNSN